MKSGQYVSLGKYYDKLSYDGVNFALYAQFIKQMAYREGIAFESGTRILDLACGTGNLTLELAKIAFNCNIIACDISCEMLSLAEMKFYECGFSPVFIQQDMKNLTVVSKLDIIACITDSLNYLTGSRHLLETLNSVYNSLKDGGIFVFDVNSLYTFEHIYSNNDYIIESEDGQVFCAWQNEYNDQTKICKFYLNIFERQKDGSYIRYDELQKERYYPLKTFKKTLEKVGFDIIYLSSDLNGSKIEWNSHKWYFVAIKK